MESWILYIDIFYEVDSNGKRQAIFLYYHQVDYWVIRIIFQWINFDLIAGWSIVWEFLIIFDEVSIYNVKIILQTEYHSQFEVDISQLHCSEWTTKSLIIILNNDVNHILLASFL